MKGPPFRLEVQPRVTNPWQAHTYDAPPRSQQFATCRAQGKVWQMEARLGASPAARFPQWLPLQWRAGRHFDRLLAAEGGVTGLQ